MNSNQFATMAEAGEIAKQLGAIGGGVVKIYVPEYHVFKAPESGDLQFLHFEFANGASGINVGLVRETIKRNKYSWPSMLAIDIAAHAKKGDD